MVNYFPGAEKSQQCHKYFRAPKSPNNVTNTFFNIMHLFPKDLFRTWGRQTCFLPRAPSNLVTPLSALLLKSADSRAKKIFHWANISFSAYTQPYRRTSEAFHAVKGRCDIKFRTLHEISLRKRSGGTAQLHTLRGYAAYCVNYRNIPGYCCQRSASSWLLPLHGAFCFCCKSKGKAFCERPFALHRQQLENDRQNGDVVPLKKFLWTHVDAVYVR